MRAAADRLAELGVTAGVVCVTSPSRLYRSFRDRGGVSDATRSAIADVLFPAGHPAPIVTVHDAHPHTLSFVGAIRGDRSRNLGVTEWGQASSVQESYRLHGIDADAIVGAALELLGR